MNLDNASNLALEVWRMFTTDLSGLVGSSPQAGYRVSEEEEVPKSEEWFRCDHLTWVAKRQVASIVKHCVDSDSLFSCPFLCSYYLDRRM